jgi:hypothetical protein
MPVVPYYCGRPARTWIVASSGRDDARALRPPAAASPVAGPPPAAQVSRPKAPEACGALAATVPTADPWAAWASNWFVPHRQPPAVDGHKAQ